MSFQAQGMRTWMLQRLTAVYIALYLVTFLIWIGCSEGLSYQKWHESFSSEVIVIATMLFYLSIFMHAWVGIRDILVDYVKPVTVRFALLTALFLFLASMSGWLLLILINMVKT